MIRCTRCIYPTTRPDSHFDAEGVCSGCRSFEARASVNWAERGQQLKAIIAEAKSRNAPYDVVVPVSGGKDSTYQVIRMLELGAKVLAVNGATDYLSDIGRRNLDNIKRLCDVIEYTPHIEVRKKLVRIGLHHIGDLSYAEHLSIWSLPTKVAVRFGIPLCVWGEQPQREYSSPKGVTPATHLNSAWVAQFGGLGGLRLDDIVGQAALTARDLDVFRFPSDYELVKANIVGIWLSDFEDWDGWKNAFIAQQHGFEVMAHPVETSLANYENVDNYVTVLRDFIRYLKFGYTRGTDIACNHIRRGRLDRDAALALEAGTTAFPKTSLGKPIEEVLAYFDLTLNRYVEQCRRWMNLDIFSGFGNDFQPVLRKANGSSHTHHTSPAE